MNTRIFTIENGSKVIGEIITSMGTPAYVVQSPEPHIWIANIRFDMDLDIVSATEAVLLFLVDEARKVGANFIHTGIDKSDPQLEVFLKNGFVPSRLGFDGFQEPHQTNQQVIVLNL